MPVPPSPDRRSLASLPVGSCGALTLTAVPAATGLRLGQLGLRPGATVTVLARTSGGGRLVGVGSTRIGLDRDTARHLELQLATVPA